MSASDEPREHSDGCLRQPCSCIAIENSFGARVAPILAAVLAAVLAEVARQDAGGKPLNWSEGSDSEWRATVAAQMIREEIRLKARGANG